MVSAAVLWGSTGTAQTFAPDEAGVPAIGAARMLLGAAGLLVLALARRRGELRPALAPRAVIPALAMVGFQLCFFAALRSTGVAIGTVVAIGTAPVIAGMLGWVIRGERPLRAWFIATGLALVGCVFLLLLGRDVETEPVGILLALGAGFSYASYAVATKDLVEKSSPLGATAVTFSIGALFMLPILFVTDTGWLLETSGLLVTLHLGIMTTTVAYLLFSRGIAVTPVATATTFSLAEPVTATILATIVLDERLTVEAIIGGLMVLSGLVILSAGAAVAQRSRDAYGRIEATDAR